MIPRSSAAGSFIPYMQLNPEMWASTAKMPMPEHPRLMMLMMGPVIGIVSGLVQGLFAFIASKSIKKK
ncbi:MAG: hypothetical protein HY840_11245 [Bacteroidetes bacterium]|nr:hypothetical protein [Bacteroidota bacterium]